MKIRLNFEEMGDREILLYLASTLCDIPDRVARIEEWQQRVMGGILVIGSVTFLTIIGVIIQVVRGG